MLVFSPSTADFSMKRQKYFNKTEQITDAHEQLLRSLLCKVNLSATHNDLRREHTVLLTRIASHVQSIWLPASKKSKTPPQIRITDCCFVHMSCDFIK